MIPIEQLAAIHMSGMTQMVSVSIFAGWEVDRSALDEGLVEIFITDIDGTSKTTFQNMWIFSEDFDFAISQIEDVSGGDWTDY